MRESNRKINGKERKLVENLTVEIRMTWKHKKEERKARKESGNFLYRKRLKFADQNGLKMLALILILLIISCCI